MLPAFLRISVITLVFMSIFFQPFQLTGSSRSPEHPRQELNQQANKLTQASSPSAAVRQPVEGTHPSTGAENAPTSGGQQPAENRQPPVEDKGKAPPISLQPEQVLPQPQQALAQESQPAQIPQIVKRVEIEGKVGLSFDDGPYQGMTEQYLEVLNKYNTRATFFMVGERVKAYPGPARKVLEQGSEVGSHSWRHAQLDKLGREMISADLRSVAQQVYETLGEEVSLFRPPYGRRSEAVLAAARELDQQVILWDVDPRDWENPPPEKIVARVLNQVKPGSIILLHEGHKNTLQALPAIIQKLRERNLEPVPVSELVS